jgi:quercetin dioxygenase-like cupin family protein
MAYKSKRTTLSSILAILAALSFAGFHTTGASAQDLPPGVTVAATGAFAPPEGLGAFQAMTFVIDVAPGASFPLHSHPGRSEVMVLQGELTEHKPAGDTKIYHAGEFFMEEPNAVHAVTNTGSDPVRLVWTLLLPDGTQPIIPHKD